jgi:hypothetical protein
VSVRTTLMSSSVFCPRVLMRTAVATLSPCVREVAASMVDGRRRPIGWVT